MIARRALLAAASSAPLPRIARAQNAWPTRPVRVVVGFAAGGGTDITTRAVAPRMQAALGQPIVVDNRPGGGGWPATEQVMRAAPDGYTLMMGTIASLVIAPVMSAPAFAAERDLTPIGLSVDVLNILVVPADRPWRSAADLIAAARARPATLAYGSSGVGSAGHLAGALFDRMAGIETVHVPYRGGGQLIADIVSGKVDFAFATAATTIPHIEAGRLRALGVPMARRSAILPDIPTVAEAASLPGFDVANWYALLGPRGLPAPIVERANAALTEALRDPAIAASLAHHGLEPRPSTPAELARFLREERETWAPIIRATGARPD
ncbi:MAG TPA: tripartite tricarboxylate transporter substrate binding protein [Acetobacteraceae bacterium]|nr:tripartite tricarboxylate transporter substrate binding protein [Acetobacteraceae bacterium]